MKTINLLNNLGKRQYNGFRSKAECLRVIRENGFFFSSALGAEDSNPKIAKNKKQGVKSRGHNLAPSRSSGLYNTCAEASLGCIEACLNTAGNPIYLPNKLKARLNRTLAFFKCRSAYVALLCFEIESHEKKAKADNMISGIRLNTTSDIPFESVYLSNGKTIFEMFPDTDFMDYTKIKKRMLKFCNGKMPANYHLTFSKSESNWESCLEVLNAGGNVAAVFDTLPERYFGFDVIDGDSHDWRPIDPIGVIVGLKAKGEAKADQSGFVIRVTESA